MARKILKQLHFYLIIFFMCHGITITLMTSLTGSADKVFDWSIVISLLAGMSIFVYDMVKMSLKGRKGHSSDILDDIFLRDKEMDRERVTFKDKQELCDILNGGKHDEYELVHNEITSSDPEDGGADHEAVIKRKSDEKYFVVYYSDWDEWYNFDRDFPSSASEVFPKQVTITVFE